MGDNDDILLTCDMCFRRIIIGTDNVNLVNEHHDYCPYVQKDDDKLMWMPVFDVLMSGHELSADGGHEADEDVEQTDQERTSRFSRLREVYFSGLPQGDNTKTDPQSSINV